MPVQAGPVTAGSTRDNHGSPIGQRGSVVPGHLQKGAWNMPRNTEDAERARRQKRRPTPRQMQFLAVLKNLADVPLGQGLSRSVEGFWARNLTPRFGKEICVKDHVTIGLCGMRSVFIGNGIHIPLSNFHQANAHL
jgi:hypothetical protein